MYFLFSLFLFGHFVEIEEELVLWVLLAGFLVVGRGDIEALAGLGEGFTLRRHGILERSTGHIGLHHEVILLRITRHHLHSLRHHLPPTDPSSLRVHQSAHPNILLPEHHIPPQHLQMPLAHFRQLQVIHIIPIKKRLLVPDDINTVFGGLGFVGLLEIVGTGEDKFVEGVEF